METVGCSGHSIGGLEAEQVLIKDKRVKACILNNNEDWDHISMGYVDSENPIAIDYGNNGIERPNAE